MAEMDAQGNISRAYGWEPDTAWGTAPLWQAEVQGTTGALATASYHYLHRDHLGTPQLATNQNGQKSWKGVSEAFGQVTPESGNQITMNLRFPGQYFDGETRLSNNYFRDYEGATGRYVESDPIGLWGGVNRYAYVDGNTLSFIDPSGLWPTGTWETIFHGAGLPNWNPLSPWNNPDYGKARKWICEAASQPPGKDGNFGGPYKYMRDARNNSPYDVNAVAAERYYEGYNGGFGTLVIILGAPVGKAAREMGLDGVLGRNGSPAWSAPFTSSLGVSGYLDGALGRNPMDDCECLK